MKTVMIDGLLHRIETVRQFRCRSCLLVTLSGSCGCSAMDPAYVSDVEFATPVNREVVAKEEAPALERIAEMAETLPGRDAAEGRALGEIAELARRFLGATA